MAQVGAEAKPHSEGCRERISQAMMNDDVGQQRLHAAGAASLASRRTTVCGNESRSGPGGPG